MHIPDQEDLIAAPATPPGRGAIAVIRASGSGCTDRLSRAFRPQRSLATAEPNRVVYGKLYGDDGWIDEVTVTVYRAPKSYTGQEMVEIGTHGGTSSVAAVMDLLRRLEFRAAEPGEFTLRRFLAGKADLTRAEAVHELVAARSTAARTAALYRLGGAIERRINDIKGSLVVALASVSVQLDYAEDEVETIDLPVEPIAEALTAIRRLASTYRHGRILRDGALVVLAGPVNAGKSSLFNRLLHEDRAIVAESAGTTRDYIEATVELAGIPVRLVDTAGMRTSEDEIERAGIRRTSMLIETADVVIALSADDAPDEAGLATDDYRVVWVRSKCDLRGDCEAGDDACSDGVGPDRRLPVSVVTDVGVDRLIDRIVDRLRVHGAVHDAREPIIESARQHDLLDRAATALDLVLEGLESGATIDMIALDLQEAVGALGEITGEVTSDDILETVFSRFCVGK
jgi:tRNA modification GTPase